MIWLRLQSPGGGAYVPGLCYRQGLPSARRLLNRTVLGIFFFFLTFIYIYFMGSGVFFFFSKIYSSL